MKRQALKCQHCLNYHETTWFSKTYCRWICDECFTELNDEAEDKMLEKLNND